MEVEVKGGMSVKRLTDKIITKACNDPWDLCELDSVCKRDCYKPTPCRIPHVVYRLAQIEDILGDTYDLERLREIASACNLIGQKVYINQWWHGGIDINNPPIEKTVYNVLITKGKGALLQFKDGAFPTYYFGKKIFKSKEDAKAALAKEAIHE